MKATWFDGPIGQGRKVLLLIATGAGVTFAVAAIDSAIVTRQIATFKTTPCFIETSTITREGIRDWAPFVRYRYRVDGREYTSTTICSRTTALTTPSAAEAFKQRFGPGADGVCFFDPDDPTSVMLELPTTAQAEQFAMFGGLALGLATVGLGLLQAATTFDTASKPQPQPLSPGWGEPDSGRNDPLARTRRIYRDKLES